MEKDSLTILVVIIGLVVVSAVMLGSQGLTGEAVKLGTKSYEIDAVTVKDRGEYSVNEVSFSLAYGESKMLLDGVKLFHESSLSSGTRFELSGACRNAHTISAIYLGAYSSGEELGEFNVRINGEKHAQFELKEGESKVLSDGSKITLLNLHRDSSSGDNRGARFELICH